MKFFKKIFLYIIIASSFQIQTHYTDLVSVVDEIHEKDKLYSALESNNPTIIELYSEHCPYCKVFSNTFEKEAPKYPSIHFIKVNGKRLNAPEIIKELNNTIKIPGYPSIVYVKNGSIVDHQIGGNPQVFAEKIKNLK